MVMSRNVGYPSAAGLRQAPTSDPSSSESATRTSSQQFSSDRSTPLAVPQQAFSQIGSRVESLLTRAQKLMGYTQQLGFPIEEPFIDDDFKQQFVAYLNHEPRTSSQPQTTQRVRRPPAEPTPKRVIQKRMAHDAPQKQEVDARSQADENSDVETRALENTRPQRAIPSARPRPRTETNIQNGWAQTRTFIPSAGSAPGNQTDIKWNQVRNRVFQVRGTQQLGNEMQVNEKRIQEFISPQSGIKTKLRWTNVTERVWPTNDVGGTEMETTVRWSSIIEQLPPGAESAEAQHPVAESNEISANAQTQSETETQEMEREALEREQRLSPQQAYPSYNRQAYRV